MKHNHALRILLVSGLILLFGAPLGALDFDRRISQYAHTAWRTQDGAFSSVPVAFTQTTDGYLWIGTPDGLLRFDGVRFVPWTSPDGRQLPRSDIKSLLGARDGSLWIGTGRGLARWKNGELVSYPGTKDWVTSIIEDRDGTIWLVRSQLADATGPLCKVTGDHVQCFGQADGIPVPSASHLVEDLSGNLWIGSYRGLCRWKAGSSSTYFQKELTQSQVLIGIESIAADLDGSLWAGVERSGHRQELQQYVQGVWKDRKLPGLSGTDSDISTLFIDRDDTLWIGTGDRGIFRVRGKNVDHFGSADGLSSDAVARFFQDREGTLWVATSKGVDSFHDVNISTFSMREGLTADSVSSVVAGRDGTVWIGDSGAVNFVQKNRISAIRERHGLPGRNVTTLFEDREGRLWLGVDSALWVFEHERFRSILRTDGRPLGVIFSITEDVDGSFWVLAAHKLEHIRDFKFSDEIDSPQVSNAYALAADPQGGIWLGEADGDLVRYRQSQFEAFTPNPGANRVQIRQLLVESDGAILGATVEGLVRWKEGTRRLLTAHNGLPCNGIYTLVKDRRDTLWLYTKCGLVVLADSEVRQWWRQADYSVKVRTLDVFDGAQPGLTPLQPQGAVSADGRLWFANDLVLQMIDPSHLHSNELPPPVHIEQIVADRKDYPYQENLRLPQLTHDLEIDYAALSYVVPQKVRYRYMLEGHDQTWLEPQMRRQAFYSDLSPGKYRFRVIACNNDGVWNETGATLNFEIPPVFYQTKAFLGLCTLVLAGILWIAYLLRLQQMAARIQGRLEERLGERERIARELHDTLLQSIQGLILRFQAAAEKIPPSEPSRLMMDKALDRADQVLVEGRDRVRNLRMSGEFVSDLSQAFAKAREDLTPGSDAEFRVVVEGVALDLHPVVRDEIYWIGHEALANSFQHAQAKNIETEIAYDQKELRLRFRDDGRGIDIEVLEAGGRKGHWGMPGMRERAHKIGAKLETWSRPGAGTEVELRIPAAVAYRRNVQRSRWHWLRSAVLGGRN
jgi:ligand-binding sensor domain-containing protein/signal transduction histidine kinase